MNLVGIMDILCRKRMIFHSEADFQFAFAWQLQQIYPQADIRLEYPAPQEGSASQEVREYIDILVRLNGDVYPIELKYKTRRLAVHLDGESFALKNHGAGDFGSYDFIKDISRLERYEDSIPGFRHGFAIWLTNDPYYWNPPRRDGTAADEFRVYEGSVKAGTLAWGSTMTETYGREKPLILNKEYTIHWVEYSIVSEDSVGVFKYSITSV